MRIVLSISNQQVLREVLVYSFTIIDATIERKKAGTDMRCPYCFPEQPNIATGQDYYFIEGFRTYERLRGRNEFVPYIPERIRNGLPNPRLDPGKFWDPIRQHRMCTECFLKMVKFFQSTGGLIITEYDAPYEFTTRHTMRRSESMFGYFCHCCEGSIKEKTIYGRRGHKHTVCNGCLELLEGFIGREFSY